MKIKHTLQTYPVLSSLAITTFFTLVWCLILSPSWTAIPEIFAAAVLAGLFCFYPFVLTALNLFFCFLKHPGQTARRAVGHIEAATLILGILFTLLLLCVVDIDFGADWPLTLEGLMVHTPVWTGAYPTVFTFLVLGVTGFVLLRTADFKKMPPLVIVCSMSFLYLGAALCVTWIIQIFTMDSLAFYLCLLPLNWVFLCIRLIREKTTEWKTIEETEKRTFDNRFLAKLNQKLMDSEKWPFWAFLLAWPLAGLAIMVLALFGQRPDNIIRAWTETSQWNLSRQISPPNLVYDEHYLCTVAARGHQKLVKPVRMGVRHGHKVVVNRQLCVANAFEQILEERSPRLHQNVRRFYDTWGFPVASLIRSPWASDVIYVLMKPLEWVFLAVIYVTDPRPEDRIRMQYIPPVPPAGPSKVFHQEREV